MLNAILILIVGAQVPVQVHELPEAGVQDSVAEPVQWARTQEEEKSGGSRSEMEQR